ncbi:MFS transporter [uncultured Treponema sp.]|uniref:MFS transporter n=1 Tax=uncultured Treponema sp. TaxID=162155 RepID=UPI0025E2283B|nr:MFS transporter [uncultured Treponema sp.]
MKTMVKYCFLQGFFWMLFCSTYGYITFYLLSRGFSASGIGIITATFGLIGAFAQPIFGRLVDRGRSGWKSLSFILILALAFCSLILVIFDHTLIQGVFFGLSLIFLNSTLPLVNRAGFICQSKSEKINYGIARGIGSLSYAFLSLVLGKLTLIFESSVVPLSTAVISLCLITVILTMPKGETPVAETQTKTSASPLSVLKKYPAFTLMWISCILQMTFHNLATTFLIQICGRAGGTSETLGFALAISAVVELPVLFCFTRINRHISSKKLLLVSGLAFIIKATGYAISLNIPILFITQLTQAISFAIYASASVYYAEEAVNSEDKTTAQSFLSGTQTIGSVAGSLAGGILISAAGIEVMLLAGIAITVIGAVFAALALKARNTISSSNSGHGSLKISRSSLSGFKNNEDLEIQFYSIIISGHDINDDDCPKINFLPASRFRESTEIKIENVPAGRDRIVTIKAFDKTKKELSVFQMRAVVDIIAGRENSVLVSKNTTAFGDVLFGVKNIFNFEELENDGRMDTVRAVIDSELPPCLFNSSKLIGELQGFSFPYSSTKADYKLSTGAVIFDYLLSQNFSVSVNDPLSSKLSNQNASGSIVLEGIAPGTWILSVSDSNGKILDRNEIQVESGKTSVLGHLEHDGIAIIMRSEKYSSGKEFKFIQYKNLKYDESVPEAEKLHDTEVPVEIITKIKVQSPQEALAQRDGEVLKEFYLYDFKNVFSAEIFITNGTEQDSEKFCLTPMIPESKGVYCVYSTGLASLTKIASWQTPIDELQITEENFRKCFIDDSANKRFVVLFSEELFGSKPRSVKAHFNKGINDHNGEYKGTHYTMTRNPKGFWYCSVQYGDVQQTNQSGQPSYNFKVDGKIIPPPDFVPDGYIYQKFNGTDKGEKFLVLIYSTQNEQFITERLSAAKKCKTLSDFDLDSEEGQKQIANFRLVPGTTNLFRSFHPYNDEDKKTVSDTSQKRMEYVAKLSETAGIKADINLSDSCQKNTTYGMPEYYQSIIDNDAVLYITDCSYSECYENSSSKKFAEGIKKIVQFINKTEGPYQIHCAIGTDRTGVVCAVLSGLCGASWAEIEADYCDSVNMGIYEYRGPGAVQYSIIHLLNVEFIEDIPDLQKSLTDYFTAGGFLTLQEIETMQEKLKS